MKFEKPEVNKNAQYSTSVYSLLFGIQTIPRTSFNSIKVFRYLDNNRPTPTNDQIHNLIRNSPTQTPKTAAASGDTVRNKNEHQMSKCSQRTLENKTHQPKVRDASTYASIELFCSTAASFPKKTSHTTHNMDTPR